MKKKEDMKKVEAPEQPVTQINNSSTFWDFIQHDHPQLLRFLIAVGFIIVLVVTYFITWIIPVFLLASVVLGHFIFRGAFFAKDSVIVVSTSEKDPVVVDVILMGKDKFRHMEKSGTAQAFSTSGGTPLYIADDVSGNKIRFPWSQETSRMEFILKREAFDKVKELAEDSTRKLHQIRHIPNILALLHSSKIIAKQEDFYTEILEGKATSEELASEVMQELEEEGIRYV